MRGKPKKGKRAKRRQRRIKRACFEEGPRFSGAKHTETGWADGGEGDGRESALDMTMTGEVKIFAGRAGAASDHCTNN